MGDDSIDTGDDIIDMGDASIDMGDDNIDLNIYIVTLRVMPCHFSGAGRSGRSDRGGRESPRGRGHRYSRSGDLGSGADTRPLFGST
jgi:hypothetical protein